MLAITRFSWSEDRDGYVGRCSLVFALILSALPALAVGPVNSWIKSTSGYWEEQFSWSLGVLPNQSQSVAITNAGWKAVAIGANTAQNFPASMQIQDLQIASPVDSFNVFLMNFSGFQVPLQTTSLSVGSNASVVVQSSSLEVINTDTNGTTGNLSLNGTFNHGDFSQVKVHGQMDISRLAIGAYYLTNGTLTVDRSVSVGFFRPGKFVQYGGANNVGSLQVNTEGEYDLYGGQLTATNGIIVGGGDFARSSSFYQYGGSVTADTIVNGNYILNGGIRTGRLTAPANTFQRVDASILQSGGTNAAVSMDLGHPNRFGGAVTYVLSNGVVHVDSSTTFGGGWFYQYDGQHTIISNFVMEGLPMPGLGNLYAEYFLKGGTLSVGSLTEHVALFTQDNGTNSIADALVLSPTHPSSSTWYKLTGGTLNVKDIEINANAFFQHTSGNVVQSGVLLLKQGEWRAANGDYILGPLQLGAPTNAIGFHTNSAIIFPDGSSTLRLANSSAQPWASNGILYITNWHGSTAGGGATQLYFGSNASGLTAQQLAQIRFALSGVLYPAKILATGEVVPVAPPRLEFTRSGGTMTLSWPSGWFLQSATNVTGPYNDVPGATSPWPVTMTSPQQFFRLRQ